MNYFHLCILKAKEAFKINEGTTSIALMIEIGAIRVFILTRKLYQKEHESTVPKWVLLGKKSYLFLLMFY